MAIVFPVIVLLLQITPPIELGELVAHPQRYDGMIVTTKGSVTRIAYAPDVRGGKTYFSFTLTDGSSSLTVLNNLAVTLNRGDQVSVTGRFSRNRVNSLAQEPGPELDATAGDLTVLIQAPPRPLPRPSRDELQGVPTVLIESKADVAAKYASILSAIFAIIASLSLLLHRRSANIDLVVSLCDPPVVRLRGDDRVLHVAIRVMSTRSLTPYLAEGIELVVGGFQTSASKVTVNERSPVFPIPVAADTTLTLEFVLDQGIAAPPGTSFTLRLRDAFARRWFVGHFKIG